MIKNKLKQFCIFILLLLPALVMAQGQTTTPYSFFGIGDTYEQGDIRSFGMGGVNLAVRSNMYINYINPASYTNIDSLSFVASIGLQSTVGTYRTNEATSNVSSSSISHIAFAFPITHWWKSSLALIPFSTTGYEVQQDVLQEFNVSSRNIYSGSGGIDRFNFGNAFRVNKNLSLGLNSTYYFGRIENRTTVIFPDSAYILNSRLQERNLLTGFQFSLGVQYFIPTGKNSNLGFAATFTPTANLNTKTDFLAITYSGDQDGYESSIDTIYNWNGVNSETTLPYAYGVGISWEKKNKILVAADFMFDNWASFSYLGQTSNLTDKVKASFGAEFIPTSNNLSSYLKLIHYRVGFRYNKLGLQFNNTELQEYALSIGFGLPLRKSNTIVNLGMEIGQNGTIESSLIQERFFKIALGVNIRESWFRKGKYF